jgi:hypothetical protein
MLFRLRIGLIIIISIVFANKTSAYNKVKPENIVLNSVEVCQNENVPMQLKIRVLNTLSGVGTSYCWKNLLLKNKV